MDGSGVIWLYILVAGWFLYFKIRAYRFTPLVVGFYLVRQKRFDTFYTLIEERFDPHYGKKHGPLLAISPILNLPYHQKVVRRMRPEGRRIYYYAAFRDPALFFFKDASIYLVLLLLSAMAEPWLLISPLVGFIIWYLHLRMIDTIQYDRAFDSFLRTYSLLLYIRFTVLYPKDPLTKQINGRYAKARRRTLIAYEQDRRKRIAELVQVPDRRPPLSERRRLIVRILVHSTYWGLVAVVMYMMLSTLHMDAQYGIYVGDSVLADALIYFGIIIALAVVPYLIFAAFRKVIRKMRSIRTVRKIAANDEMAR